MIAERVVPGFLGGRSVGNRYLLQKSASLQHSMLMMEASTFPLMQICGLSGGTKSSASMHLYNMGNLFTSCETN